MTRIDLASLPVDHHPHPTIGKLNLNSLSSRPGTPIVTPRTNFPIVNLPNSRPVSRLTDLGTPPEETEEEEEEEEESEEEETRKELENYKNKVDKNWGEGYDTETDNCEDPASTFSGLSISTSSGCDTFSSAPRPLTPPTVRTKCHSRDEEGRELGPSCIQRDLKTSSSRAPTAASSSYKTRHSRYCSCTSRHHSSEVKMVDAKVIYASSHDPKYPPAAAVDGRHETFWASSGLYPQFLVVSLPGLTSIENVNLVSYNVRKVSVARSIKAQPTDFEEVKQEELQHTEGKLQEFPIVSQNINAIHLRITIEEGYNHFCSVNQISVAGSVNPAYGGNTAPQTVAPKFEAAPPPTRNVENINTTPTYHRPQSPIQVMTKGPPPLTMVEQADDDEDDLSEYAFNHSSTNLKPFDDGDEF